VSRPIQRENAVPHLVGELPPLRDTTALRELVERAVRQAGNPSKLARALQVTQSHVSRLRQGACGLSATLMLRLADFLDEDGVAILRICGHVCSI
jgi:plasmid maintenance system antidote protein VapI